MKQEIENKEIVNSDLRVKNREISDYNNILIESNLDNLDKIKSYETVMNEEYQFLLRDLCVQIDFSKIKLEILVTNCIKIRKGEDVDPVSLVYDIGSSATRKIFFQRSYNMNEFLSILKVTDADKDEVRKVVLTPEYLRSTIRELKKTSREY